MDQKEVFVKETIQLKRLTLSSLPKLKNIWEQNFQEIVSFRETTEGHVQHHRLACCIQQVRLPNLEKIIIQGMLELKTIWHPCFTSNCFDNLEMMQVSDCEKLENIFPSYMQRAFASLKTLMVSDCKSVQVIFEFSSELGSAEETTRLQKLTLLRLLKLKQIWGRAQTNFRFQSLQLVWVEHCENLEYLFPFSIAMHVIQPEFITIKYVGSMKHIVSNKEGPMDSPIKLEFNHLISLVLWHLYELEGFYAGNHSILCPLLRELDIRQCGKLKLFNTQNTSGQERVFDSNKLLISTRHPLFTPEEVSFSSLETLKLTSINLEKIWDYDHLSIANCIHNLVDLTVEDCRGLKHLFSYSAIESLLKLKHLEISRCEMMEEIIAPKGINNIALEEVRLSKLETLVIKDMKSLKNAWHFQFESLKTLEVSNCGKLVNIFPSAMHGTFGSLETLKVSDCGSVEEIFESTAKEIHSEDETTTQVSQLKKLRLLGLPILKQIWSREGQANYRVHNLLLVHVEHCVNLEYLFPFSIAMQAIQLEFVTIKHAWSMKQIVSHKEGILDSPVNFEFNHLISLLLWNLYELNGFFAENHSLLCPSLRELDIRQCEKLKLFKTKSTSGRQRVFDSKLQISIMQQPLFTLEEVICNLERLALNSEDANMILQGQFSGEHFSKLKYLCLANFEEDQATFPYWFLQNITILKELHVECSSFKEIFQEEIPIDDKEKFKIKTRIEELTLNQLHDLQHICKQGFQIDPILEDLEYLSVQYCSKLKHLVPSSVTCGLLTYLEVQNCNGLIDLITSSTAKSMVHLMTMIIRNCNSLEQVVTEDREGSKDVIAFDSLESLELECLPRLKMFCSSSYCLLELPWLYEVVISNCPRMEIFSLGKTHTPELQGVLTRKKDEKELWQGDLNTTVNKIFQDMADQIVDTTKQQIPDLPSSSDDRKQKENASSTDPQGAEGSHAPSIGTQKMSDAIKKPSISTTQHVPSSTMIPNEGTMYPPPSQAPELAVAQSTEESHDSYIDTIKNSSSPEAQNVPNSNMIRDTAAIDPSSSKAPEPMASSILECNTYNDYKWLIDISKQNLPYLEAGLKRHPQVLDWFNTKRRRAFIALFSEVTCILRTTRRRHLTEDDRNYIRECCVALEAVGFDASWLSYVHGCIESCGDGDELMRKLEETEAKASTLRNELASIEASLVLLRDEANRLDTFIES